MFNPDDSGSEPSPATGMLLVRISETVTANSTIQPDVEMVIDEYHITVSGPGDTQSTTVGTAQTEATFNELERGEWTVTVNAKNASGVIIASDLEVVIVDTGETATADILVVPLGGEGTLDLSISWPGGSISTPSVEATITPSGGTAESVVFTTESTAATYSGSWTAGYYELAISLNDGIETVWSLVVAVRVIEGEVSSGVFPLDEDDLEAGGDDPVPSGAILVNIGTDLNSPYTIMLTGIEETIEHGNDMIVELNLNPDTPPDGINWYMNGSIVPFETNPGIIIGPSGLGLLPGSYWLDVLVRKGTMVSSQRARFHIAPEVEGPVAAVSAGGDHTMILRTDGTLWATGWNHSGQLGDGSTTNRSSPVQIMTDVAAVSAGQSHTMILKTDGTLWGTGRNSEGQLGDGTSTNRSSPVHIVDSVEAVSAGSKHTMFIKSDGTLWAMGDNWIGQLGDGSTTNRSSPVEIMASVGTVSSGSSHTMILKDDKTLWGTGYNGNGCLGIGTTSDYMTPVLVMNNVASVSAGVGHTMILKTDGTLWGTGRNSEGQLGDETTTNRTNPVQTMTSVAAVSAGDFHTMILKNGGFLWAVGSNQYGQLGDGTTSARRIPVEITNDVVAVSSGRNHTMFLKGDRTLWGMGDNWNGQLGDGTSTEHHSQIQIVEN
jgi:alpha-tubulin suppressor-like RCC1 family protein